MGGQGGCEQRIEFFFFFLGGGGGGGGMCLKNLSYCENAKKRRKKCKKKWGGGVGWLVARLRVVGDVQYWGCKQRIEGIVKRT